MTGIQNHKPTERFSNRVEAYVRYRPRYPAEMVTTIMQETGLTPAAVVADIGSGTGFSAQPFLANGNRVFGVEPNEGMAAAGQQLLADFASFVSVNGTAEATTLADASIDLIVAGQAFHWFDRVAARREFVRILKPNGWVALFWNTRRDDASVFMADYEALLRRYSDEYAQVYHTNVTEDDFHALYAGSSFTYATFANPNRLTFDQLLGRTLSSSYMPTADDPTYAALVEELRRLFTAHQVQGEVGYEYFTELYLGRVV